MTCYRCLYFEKKTQIQKFSSVTPKEAKLGICKRHPRSEVKDEDDVCGEWVPI